MNYNPQIRNSQAAPEPPFLQGQGVAGPGLGVHLSCRGTIRAEGQCREATAPPRHADGRRLLACPITPGDDTPLVATHDAPLSRTGCTSLHMTQGRNRRAISCSQKTQRAPFQPSSRPLAAPGTLPPLPAVVTNARIRYQLLQDSCIRSESENHFQTYNDLTHPAHFFLNIMFFS